MSIPGMPVRLAEIERHTSHRDIRLVLSARGVRRSLAVFCRGSLSLVADDEGAGGCFDDIVGDGFELVDLQYAGDLGEEPFEQPEVAAGDSLDRGDCLGVGEVVGVE